MERDKDGWPSWWTLNFSREQPFEAAQDAFATFVNGMFDPVDKSDRWYAERFFKSFFYDYDEKKKGVMGPEAGAEPGEPTGMGMMGMPGGNGGFPTGDNVPGGDEFQSSKDQEYTSPDF